MPALPVEEILLPLLKLMRGGERTLHQAVHLLAGYLAFTAGQRRELEENFMYSPFTAQVGSAWALLARAGLLEGGTRQTHQRISPRGLRVLEEKPERLTIRALEQFPEFLAAREEDALRQQALEFRELRLQYYASGRKLLVDGAFLAAPILLGYAIEMALKAGLAKTKRAEGLVRRSHDLSRLYRKARELSLFEDTWIAPDFLEYAADNFFRRYPVGERVVLQRRGRWSIGLHSLATYDDCICQLDSSLAAAGDDDVDSMISFALHEPRVAHLAKDLFADNPFAVLRARRYLDSAAGSRAGGGFAGQLAHDRDLTKSFQLLSRRAGELLALNLAALYRYPARDEPDPNPLLCARESRTETTWPVSNIRWLLKRLREEFGSHSVRLEEIRYPRDHMVLYVFDRTAENWWCPLPLGNKLYLALWLQNKENEKALATWISRTKGQFCQKRKDLLPEASTD